MSRLIVVSADGHAGAMPSDYQDYLDEPYRDMVEVLERENEEFNRVFGSAELAPDVLAAIDEGGAMSSGGDVGGCDMQRRLQELDREGIAAEVILPGYQKAIQPFFSVVSSPYPADVRAAGMRAYHRWLADGMADTDGRLVGVGEPGPCLDMEETVREVRWLAAHGYKAISPPGNTADPSLPPLHDPYFFPFWDACAELGLVIVGHAGWGHQQGRFQEFAKTFLSNVVGADAEFHKDSELEIMEAMSHTGESPLALDMGPRRLVWQMMLGGVFDRHPDLKLVLTEVRADWVPATLRRLDRRYEQGGTRLTMPPSEYFQRHCRVTPSSIHLAEVEMRHEIGVELMMFGADYPHAEGTWPNTRDWTRAAFAGVPEDEAQKILADNAIECFGFDRAKLTAIAERVGPDSQDVLAPNPQIDPKRLEHFDFRAGFSRGAEEVDEDLVDSLFEEDIRAATITAG